ncbi:hypothetical protein M9H77_07845 [Catharanthus roseus]|uniref:Uncharacterized protein n=1 Tax=Catharanthus roseus TaxID=4058 RepID=A0ACC0BW32_CATRO|nr:hypothetical protein M9H77_07845 [Catharanthus roseus]
MVVSPNIEEVAGMEISLAFDIPIRIWGSIWALLCCLVVSINPQTVFSSIRKEILSIRGPLVQGVKFKFCVISSFLGEAGLKSRTSHRRQDIFTGDGVDLGEVSGPAMALLKVAGTCSPPVKLHENHLDKDIGNEMFDDSRSINSSPSVSRTLGTEDSTSDVSKGRNRKLDSVICLAKVPKVSTHIKIDAKDVEDVIKKWGYSELVACVVGAAAATFWTAASWEWEGVQGVKQPGNDQGKSVAVSKQQPVLLDSVFLGNHNKFLATFWLLGREQYTAAEVLSYPEFWHCEWKRKQWECENNSNIRGTEYNHTNTL